MDEARRQVTKEMKPVRAIGVRRAEWQEVGDSQDSLLVCTSIPGSAMRVAEKSRQVDPSQGGGV